MDDRILTELAGNVPLDDLDQSIVVSARVGVFTMGSNRHFKRGDTSLLDLSSMMQQPDNPARNRQMMADAMAASRSSRENRPGQFKAMLTGLMPVDEGSMMSSQRSIKTHERIENARNVIRKNSNHDHNMRASTQSRLPNQENLQPIGEETSLEQSRINPSGEIDEEEGQSARTAGGGLAGIFEQTAAE